MKITTSEEIFLAQNGYVREDKNLVFFEQKRTVPGSYYAQWPSKHKIYMFLEVSLWFGFVQLWYGKSHAPVKLWNL